MESFRNIYGKQRRQKHWKVASQSYGERATLQRISKEKLNRATKIDPAAILIYIYMAIITNGFTVSMILKHLSIWKKQKP